jgi:exopolyphosphatase/guanosine-5'-triphosphate,3'-diphosphate pyrophosphatase
MRLSGIDIGTNTIRLLIAELDPGAPFREVCSGREITRLGENLVFTGRLSDAAMDRTLRVLKRFKDLCDRHEAEGILSVATSAVREADNGRSFVEQIREETGLRVRVLSGNEEAALTLKGVAYDLHEVVTPPGPILAMDIGGGSTEFILFRLPTGGEGAQEGNGQVLFQTSTDLGVVRMTERYLLTDPASDRDFDALVEAIDSRMAGVRLPEGCSPQAIVGTAGTVTTLAAIHLGLVEYEPRQVHHYILRRETVEDLLHRFRRMTAAQRGEIPGLEAGREDIILSGTAIVQRVMEHFSADEMIVSDFGLREGVVWALYEEMSGVL